MTTKHTPGPWSIRQLKQAMLCDLEACHTTLEINMVKTIGGKEIRELAEKLSKTRKLTPGEVAISEEFGFRGS